MIIDSGDCLCKFQPENKSNTFGVLKAIYELVIVAYNNISKGHVNFNSVTNFGVLGPGYTKVCIDHVDFNSVPNFGAEITSSRSRKLASWGPALPIFAEILVMICKLLRFLVLVCSKVGFCLFRGQVIATPLNFASAGLKTPIFVTLLSFIISIMSCERNLHDLRKLWRRRSTEIIRII